MTGALLTALFKGFGAPGGQNLTESQRREVESDRRTALLVAGVSVVPMVLGFFGLAGRTTVDVRQLAAGSARAPFVPLALGRTFSLTPSGLQF